MARRRLDILGHVKNFQSRSAPRSNAGKRCCIGMWHSLEATRNAANSYNVSMLGLRNFCGSRRVNTRRESGYTISTRGSFANDTGMLILQ